MMTLAFALCMQANSWSLSGDAQPICEATYVKFEFVASFEFPPETVPDWAMKPATIGSSGYAYAYLSTAIPLLKLAYVVWENGDFSLPC
jgi:hypothetical protein